MDRSHLLYKAPWKELIMQVGIATASCHARRFPLRIRFIWLLAVLGYLYLGAPNTPAAAQKLEPPAVPVAQVGETPVPPSPFPGTLIPGTPGETPTFPLTGTITTTVTVTVTVTVTPTIEVGAALETQQATETPPAETAASLTGTPTPFRYIRVEPREVARSLLENIVATLLILIAAWVVAGLARALVIRLAGRVHPDVKIFLGRLVYIGVWVGAILWILRVFDVEVATLTAIVGTLGLAFSLSSQDLFKNFIAGMYLLLERPFLVGDNIKVGDYTGKVAFIDLRTTKLITADGTEIILPNTLLMSQAVVKLLDAGEQAEAVQAAGGLPPEEPLDQETNKPQ